VKAFTEAGLELGAEALAACWAPEAEFKRFEKTVKSIPAFKRAEGAPPASPFAAPPAGGGTTSGRMLA
jgi:hypothetical protein